MASIVAQSLPVFDGPAFNDPAFDDSRSDGFAFEGFDDAGFKKRHFDNGFGFFDGFEGFDDSGRGSGSITSIQRLAQFFNLRPTFVISFGFDGTGFGGGGGSGCFDQRSQSKGSSDGPGFGCSSWISGSCTSSISWTCPSDAGIGGGGYIGGPGFAYGWDVCASVKPWSGCSEAELDNAGVLDDPSGFSDILK